MAGFLDAVLGLVVCGVVLSLGCVCRVTSGSWDQKRKRKATTCNFNSPFPPIVYVWFVCFVFQVNADGNFFLVQSI